MNYAPDDIRNLTPEQLAAERAEILAVTRDSHGEFLRLISDPRVPSALFSIELAEFYESLARAIREKIANGIPCFSSPIPDPHPLIPLSPEGA